MQRSCTFAAIGLIVLAAGSAAIADSLVEVADRDNTMYESDFGELSNGAGTDFFVGRTASNALRRGLIHFDLSDIPCGSTINSVQVTLRMTQTISGAEDVSLHRALADWGEGASVAVGGGGGGGFGGPSTPGDATWVHTSFATSFWASPGGDFAAAASATTSVAGTGSYAWGSSAALVADVQQWVDDSSTNAGWVVVGNELAAPTAKRFATRENIAGFRPTVDIDFTPPAGCASDLNGDVSVGFADLNILLGNWGACSGCAGDIDCNGVIGFADLSTLLGDWGPCT